MGRNGKIKLEAFTLIELLVVIAVIGILAGILLGVMPAAQSKSARSRVKVDMNAIATAIESYKAKHNFYPPSIYTNGFPNSLFYELTGTTHEPAGAMEAYTSKFSPNDPPLTEAQLTSLLGIKGFLNTAPPAEASDVLLFYKTLRPAQVRDITTNGVTFKALATGRKGMDGQPAVWHYVSKGIQNVGEFDLWAEVELRGEKVIIGNWEK